MSFLNASRTEIRMLTAENGDGESRVLVLYDGVPCLISAVRQDYFCETYQRKFAEAQSIALPTDEQLRASTEEEEEKEGGEEVKEDGTKEEEEKKEDQKSVKASRPAQKPKTVKNGAKRAKK